MVLVESGRRVNEDAIGFEAISHGVSNGSSRSGGKWLEPHGSVALVRAHYRDRQVWKGG